MRATHILRLRESRKEATELSGDETGDDVNRGHNAELHVGGRFGDQTLEPCVPIGGQLQDLLGGHNAQSFRLNAVGLRSETKSDSYLKSLEQKTAKVEVSSCQTTLERQRRR